MQCLVVVLEMNMIMIHHVSCYVSAAINILSVTNTYATPYRYIILSKTLVVHNYVDSI